ncbi:MAG: S8 family peptidase [Pseudanabaenaceae cyanobacterium bins.68]|nr:S8 family peptidase [Pseudanabaenaceae cyanobacterium bins.68]
MNDFSGFADLFSSSSFDYLDTFRPQGFDTSDRYLALNSETTIQSSFDFDYGFGLINANAAVSMALGLASNFSPVPDPLVNSYGADLIDVPAVWAQGYTGRDVVVAVIDTGIDLNHPDLAGSFWRNPDEIAGDRLDNDNNGYVDDLTGYDFVSRDGNPIHTTSRELHGTHVAGIISANRNGVNAIDSNNQTYEVTGIAYDALIMPIRVLNSSGRGNSQAVASGIRYAVDNGADIINLSLGSPMISNLELEALRYAEQKGVVVVAAAGNNGYTAVVPEYPARLAATEDFGIAVGAVDRNQQVAQFSNPAGDQASYPFVVAPGVSILSTIPNGNYGILSGTSMAAPHVTGVVALMLQANPNLTPTQVKDILSQTAGAIA